MWYRLWCLAAQRERDGGVQHMFCLSFKLSAAVAFAAEGNYNADGSRRPHHIDEPVVADTPTAAKRIKLEYTAKDF
jgi:hypothetical protein